ncbi:MAG TPA: VWA domain-containing protein [Thermoanaerobaculia bacterium]|nr:VWA domain-containing protein [Thermoanaerobaculia bacterium]
MPPRGVTHLPFLLVLLVLAAPLPAQTPRFGETTSVVVVEVPVNVVKDGKPVRGLTAADFEVLEGKTRRAITGFEVIDLGAVAAAPRRLPIAARRHFLFLFDLTFAQPRSIVQAREAALDLAAEGLHASDLGAVATYSASRGAELVLGFTSDRGQLAAAIRSLGLPQLVNRAPDPLRLIVADIENEFRAPTAPGIKGGSGRFSERRGEVIEAIGYQMTEILDDIQRDSFELQGREAQNRVVALTRSFSDLAQMMASVDGRKHVVYLSEGFEARSATGRGTTQQTGDAVSEGQVWESESETVYGSSRVQGDVERMLEAFRRADCVVQAVDIGGARTTGAEAATELAGDTAARGDGRDALLTMARDTGGELFQNANDLSAAMARMLERTSVTYLLSFQPEALAQDGAFHPLKVRLKGGPRGARVSHRAGYYAPNPMRVAQPLEQRLVTASEILGSEEGGSLPVSALAVPLAGSGGKAVVPLLLEVDGPALLAGHVGRALGVEIYAYALGAGGAVEGFLTQRLDLDLDKVEDELRAGGLRFYGELELPPGAYSVRLLVKNAQMGGATALRSLPVEVPAAAGASDGPAPGPVVSAPLFVAAGGGWLLARQAPREGAPPRDYPFTLGGQPFLPDARPVLAAAGEARVALLAYNLGSGEWVARAEVLHAGDRGPAAGGGFRLVERQPGEGGAPDRLVGIFDPAGLTPGEYVLRVTLTDRASGASHSSVAAFVVGG